MSDEQPVTDATLVLGMLLTDPVGLGGAVLVGRPGYLRDRWLSVFQDHLAEETPFRRLPVNIDDDRLIGGLDIVATLTSMKPVVARGVLAECHQGVAILPMAERLLPGTAARICAVMDSKSVTCEREGITRQWPAEICVIALDEHVEDEEGISPDLEDRLAFSIFTDDPECAALNKLPWSENDVGRARVRLKNIDTQNTDIEHLVNGCLALGIDSMRSPLLALRAACASAALEGRDSVNQSDLETAARLVLLPRARQWPINADEQEEQPQESMEEQPPPEPQDDQQPSPDREAIPEEVLLQAAAASLPPDLLNRLYTSSLSRRKARGGGRFGGGGAGNKRGRPIGVRRGKPGGGARLNILATLKAAVPWQGIRKKAPEHHHQDFTLPTPRLRVYPDDLHLTRYKIKHESTVIFLVDASGSAAAQRLAESKGAVELLLSQCYVRRDQVALLAFRGKDAEVLLPPTRAMARARRELAALPGGGGTPMAAGFQATARLAEDVERRGRRPVIVVMTDGRANIASDGTPGHAQATEDAENTAKFMQARRWETLFIDTSRRPRRKAREIADALGAHYLPMPHASAHTLNDAIRGTVLS
ncbi:MAG TPA: magnesium chelatase subunit D [Xanthomonadales bacterium]|nr:magnesium chelatase subunit D [Xanthomonadales bacterium]